ncbi:hypothetical protein K4A83_22755, partial [Spirulina subsalsa FACHB-351]
MFNPKPWKSAKYRRMYTAIFVCLLPFLLALGLSLLVPSPSQFDMTVASSSELLTDPFLQYPTPNSVRVVWFTEFPGVRHWVNYGRDLELKAIATSQQLSRLREDARSRIPTPPTQPTFRPIWRHEALITPLTPGQRLPYQVTSLKTPEDPLYSAVFTLT